MTKKFFLHELTSGVLYEYVGHSSQEREDAWSTFDHSGVDSTYKQGNFLGYTISSDLLVFLERLPDTGSYERYDFLSKLGRVILQRSKGIAGGPRFIEVSR